MKGFNQSLMMVQCTTIYICCFWINNIYVDWTPNNAQISGIVRYNFIPVKI